MFEWPAWAVNLDYGVFGVTFRDGHNLDTLQQPGDTSNPASSPNTTQVAEVYPQAFEQFRIYSSSGTFASAPPCIGGGFECDVHLVALEEITLLEGATLSGEYIDPGDDKVLNTICMSPDMCPMAADLCSSGGTYVYMAGKSPAKPWDEKKTPSLGENPVIAPPGAIPPRTSQGGEDHRGGFLEPGQVASAEFEVALPPPGDYVIEASRRSAFTEQTLVGGNDTISVRRGDEDEPIRLLFLKSQRVGREFPEFRAIQMKLLEQQPDNWYLWEELANMSLGEAALEETLSYYETAERKYRHFLTVTGSPIGDREAAVLTFLGLFARLAPFYREAANEVTLMPERHGLYRTFRWVERAEDRTRQPSMIRVRGESEARPRYPRRALNLVDPAKPGPPIRSRAQR